MGSQAFRLRLRLVMPRSTSKEGYSCLVADTNIAGAVVPLSFSGSFVAQEILLKISAESVTA